MGIFVVGAKETHAVAVRSPDSHFKSVVVFQDLDQLCRVESHDDHAQVLPVPIRRGRQPGFDAILDSLQLTKMRLVDSALIIGIRRQVETDQSIVGRSHDYAIRIRDAHVNEVDCRFLRVQQDSLRFVSEFFRPLPFAKQLTKSRSAGDQFNPLVLPVDIVPNHAATIARRESQMIFNLLRDDVPSRDVVERHQRENGDGHKREHDDRQAKGASKCGAAARNQRNRLLRNRFATSQTSTTAYYFITCQRRSITTKGTENTGSKTTIKTASISVCSVPSGGRKTSRTRTEKGKTL